MKAKYTFTIILEEEDVLGNKTAVPVVGINQLYKNVRSGRALTKEATKYIKFLQSKTQDIRKELGLKNNHTMDDYGQWAIFLRFYLSIPLTRKGELDTRYIRDEDNLIKPFKDAFQTEWDKIGLWNNDKTIRLSLAEIIENEYPESRIVVSLIKRDEKLKKRIDNFF